MTIRKEAKEDISEVRILNELAFGQPLEANIVDKLRNNCDDLLSLVATENEKIVGHILFSPAEIEGPQGVVKGMGLAPARHAKAWHGNTIGKYRNRRIKETSMPIHYRLWSS